MADCSVCKNKDEYCTECSNNPYFAYLFDYFEDEEEPEDE